jgi:hypothetical protein
VRVVSYARGGVGTNYAWNPHTINDRHTVQAAVEEVYSLFPGDCARVDVMRDGRFSGVQLYNVLNTTRSERQIMWARDLYSMVTENDQIEIDLFQDTPRGARESWAGHEVPGEYDLDYHEAEGTKKPAGPHVGALLQRLGELR